MQYLVIGDPVEQSLSPDIHQAFAKQFSLSIDYERQQIAQRDFIQQIEALRKAGLEGASVTTPLKSLAFEYADACSDNADLVKNASCLKFSEKKCYAANFDGPGLVADIKKNRQWPIEKSKILLLGAGGASAGIIPSLLQESPAEIAIANRTQTRASTLVSRFQALGNISAIDPNQIPWDDYQLIINGTSASLQQALPHFLPETLSLQSQYCYDLSYHKEKDTVFCAWARKNQASAIADGLGMLVEQAALTFELWFDKLPDTTPIYQLLNKPLHP